MWPCSEAATADGHARYARLARYNPAPPPLWGEVPESGWRVRVSLATLHKVQVYTLYRHRGRRAAPTPST